MVVVMNEFIVKYLDDIGCVHIKTFRADNESQVWKQHKECGNCNVISVKLKYPNKETK